MYTFKWDIQEKKEDIFLLHPQLLQIYFEVCNYCMKNYSMIPSITSMIRPKRNDSGVHATGRAMDISRCQYDDNGIAVLGTLPQVAIDEVVALINTEFPRSDDYKTIKYHSEGIGYHFHLQIAFTHHWARHEQTIRNILATRSI